MTAVEFREFKFDPGVEIAPVIYRDNLHRVTPRGAIVDPATAVELLRFASEYASFLDADKPFFRMDAYLSDAKLVVLEVNTCFVDGWGIALNLSRAVGMRVAAEKLGFPRWFGLIEDAYRPELELLVAELRAAGQADHWICEHWCEEIVQNPVYVYGRIEAKNVWPPNGLALDNKLHLARFSRQWQGELVVTPASYTYEHTSWADVPGDVFLKFCDKSGLACRRAGFSVRYGKPSGKAPYLRRCYDRSELIAQDYIEGVRRRIDSHERQVQLVVLTNAQILTGYVQYGLGHIVNDNSIHAPLLFQE